MRTFTFKFPCIEDGSCVGKTPFCVNSKCVSKKRCITDRECPNPYKCIGNYCKKPQLKFYPLTVIYEGKNYIACGPGTFCEEQYKCTPDARCCKNETCYSPIPALREIAKKL